MTAAQWAELLTRWVLYVVSLVCVVWGAAGLWGPAAAMFAGGAHLLVGLKVGHD